MSEFIDCLEYTNSVIKHYPIYQLLNISQNIKINKPIEINQNDSYDNIFLSFYKESITSGITIKKLEIKTYVGIPMKYNF